MIPMTQYRRQSNVFPFCFQFVVITVCLKAGLETSYWTWVRISLVACLFIAKPAVIGYGAFGNGRRRTRDCGLKTLS